MKPIAPAIAAMKRSGIREIMDLAARQPDVIHLEVGEPNFATPDHVLAAAAQAGADGYTKYTPNRGLPEVREAMAAKIAARNGFTVGVDQIVVTTGAVNGLMEALLTLTEPGDPLLLPDPAWPNYVMMAAIAGARVVRYPLLRHEGFLPDLEALDRVCGDHPAAKAIVLNSPSNPTGAVYPREVVEGMLEIAARHDLYILSDECYDDIVFEGVHTSPASIDPDRVVTTFSVSKSYAMTGWRIGYLTASPTLSAAIAKVQEAVISCTTGVAQKAAQAALEGDQTCVSEMRDSYRARRDRVVAILDAAGMALSRPRGAFYVMADTSATGLNGYDLAKRLILEHGVALAPGETFGPGGAGTMRISLATAMDDLVEGVTRLTDAVRAWS